MRKKALITGITGQDGSYLAEMLLQKGYDVYGVVRHMATEEYMDRIRRIAGIREQLTLLPCDIKTYPCVFKAINSIQPDEIYHLAAQSFVGESFDNPHGTMMTNIMGTLNIYEAVRVSHSNAKVYFAGSSEMFGRVHETPQTEHTPFHPRSPYGISKVAGFNISSNYRETYGIFSCGAILFDHESSRQGEEFVTQKIIKGVVKWLRDHNYKIHLGNIDTKRDWGHPKDYVRAAWLMLQQEKADDYVIATGETHTIKEFLGTAFEMIGEDYSSKIVIDKKIHKPADMGLLRGDYSKAKHVLGWEPTYSFKDLVEEMLHTELLRNGMA